MILSQIYVRKIGLPESLFSCSRKEQNILLFNVISGKPFWEHTRQFLKLKAVTMALSLCCTANMLTFCSRNKQQKRSDNICIMTVSWHGKLFKRQSSTEKFYPQYFAKSISNQNFVKIKKWKKIYRSWLSNAKKLNRQAFFKIVWIKWSGNPACLRSIIWCWQFNRHENIDFFILFLL